MQSTCSRAAPRLAQAALGQTQVSKLDGFIKACTKVSIKMYKGVMKGFGCT